MFRQTIIAVLFVCFVSTSSVLAGTWRDDFEDGNASAADWEGFDFLELEDGEYSIKFFNAAQDVIGLIRTGNATWKDYTVRCKMRYISEPSGWAGINFRDTGMPWERYGFNINADDKTADGWKAIQPPAVIKLSKVPLTFALSIDIWYQLKVIAKGDHFEFYIDGKPAGEFKDKSIPSGKVGFFVRNAHAHFDDFIVSGDDVKDGGNWDPAKHPEEKAVEPKSKLAKTWGKIKSN